MDANGKVSNGKRLIDANAMRDDWLENGENEYVYDTNAVLDSIDLQPTVDAVEVVRCKDCKHYDTVDFSGNILYGCNLHPAMFDITPDGFCSYGERKEGAENG